MGRRNGGHCRRLRAAWKASMVYIMDMSSQSPLRHNGSPRNTLDESRAAILVEMGTHWTLVHSSFTSGRRRSRT